MTLLPQQQAPQTWVKPAETHVFLRACPIFTSDAVQPERGLEPESSAAAGTGGRSTAGT